LEEEFKLDIPDTVAQNMKSVRQVVDSLTRVLEGKDVADLVAALGRRHEDFHEAGCRLSDHGLDTALAEPCTLAEARAIFDAAVAAARVLEAAPFPD